jgi:hypothetical protein
MLWFRLSCFAFLAASAAAQFVIPNDDQNMSGVVVNGIPYNTRVKYMRLVSLLSNTRCLLALHLTLVRPTKPFSSKAAHVLSPLMALLL